MINKINSNISSSGKSISLPLLGYIADKSNCTRYIKIGREYTPIYPSSYKQQYFEKLAKEAELNESIKEAKFWQEIADRKKVEESYLDLKI